MKTSIPTPSARTLRGPPTTSSRRSARAAFVRAHLFAVDIDRTKPIDRYIDYFGSGRAGRTLAIADTRGGSARD
jgi:hypothetical protein